MRSEVIKPERRAHAAEVVSRNGQNLARLIEDLLDISRIETGHITLRLRPVELVAVARTALDSSSADAASKGVALRSRLAGREVIVKGDSDRLLQIIRNLLSNGIKFTPPGGEVELDVDTRGETAQLVVRDTGKGMDPAFVPHVFERFRQEDGTATRAYGGLGLGLSIVRELAELHGGSVDAYSAGVGQGSRFTVTLPLATDVGALTNEASVEEIS